MKLKNLLTLTAVAALIITMGCVKTQSGRRTGGVPLVQDSAKGLYERTPTQVYNAAKEVVRFNGTLVNEITTFGEDGASVWSLEGRVQERKVFIGVKAEDPKITSVVVQVRTTAGGTDQVLAYELEKQIALKLVR